MLFAHQLPVQLSWLTVLGWLRRHCLRYCRPTGWPKVSRSIKISKHKLNFQPFQPWHSLMNWCCLVRSHTATEGCDEKQSVMYYAVRTLSIYNITSHYDLQQRCRAFLGQGPQNIIFCTLEGRKTKLLAELSRVAYKKPILITFY